MEHKVTLGTGVAIGRPVHIECTCGTGGDFVDETRANAYIELHRSRIGASETLNVTKVSQGAAKQKNISPPSKVPTPPPPGSKPASATAKTPTKVEAKGGK